MHSARQLMKMFLCPFHELRLYGEKLSTDELPIPQAARMQRNGAVRPLLLHLGADKVALAEKRTHVELILICPSALNAAGQVDRRQ